MSERLVVQAPVVPAEEWRMPADVEVLRRLLGGEESVAGWITPLIRDQAEELPLGSTPIPCQVAGCRLTCCYS